MSVELAMRVRYDFQNEVRSYPKPFEKMFEAYNPPCKLRGAELSKCLHWGHRGNIVEGMFGMYNKGD